MLNSFRPPDLPDLSWRTERKERPFAALAPLWSVPNEFAMPSRKSMAEGRPKGPRPIVRGFVPGRSHYLGVNGLAIRERSVPDGSDIVPGRRGILPSGEPPEQGSLFLYETQAVGSGAVRRFMGVAKPGAD